MNNFFPLTDDWEVLITDTEMFNHPGVYMVHVPCDNFKTLYAILLEGPVAPIISMRFGLRCKRCYKYFPPVDYLTPKILQFIDLHTILELNI